MKWRAVYTRHGAKIHLSQGRRYLACGRTAMHDLVDASPMDLLCGERCAKCWPAGVEPQDHLDAINGRKVMTQRTIGDALCEGIIDTMAEDLEMDAEDIATELEACGYDQEEAATLAERPWKRLPPLQLACTECPATDTLHIEDQGGEVCISAGNGEEGVDIYFGRAGAEQVHSWLGEWLGR